MTEWMPIKSAPRERGSVIVGMGPRYGDTETCWVRDLWWHDGEQGWFDHTDYDGPYHPTHWMPAPLSKDYAL